MVRYTDNATPQPEEIDKIINYHLSLKTLVFHLIFLKYITRYPDGIGAEVLVILLAEINSKNLSKEKGSMSILTFDYETGTPVDETWCPVINKLPKKFGRPDLILDINTYEQYIY